MALMLLALRGRDGLGRLLHPAPDQIEPKASAADTESGHFALCRGRERITCVVDGDTIWYRREKIRIADINAPEVSDPQCDHELDLGEKATDRLVELLNAGPFSLVPLPDRDADVYGRKLRTIRRGGQSLGAVLVAEGLAERWVGYRRDWCK
ncbi:MAG: thermonuclease family protein [Proteobacteria bacterium]|nr:thermonuclease family protein [Pseudomonadota bacterium]